MYKIINTVFILLILILSVSISECHIGGQIKGGFYIYEMHFLKYVIGGRLYCKAKTYMNIGIDSTFAFRSLNYQRSSTDYYTLFIGPDLEFFFFTDNKPPFDPFVRFSGGYVYSKTIFTETDMFGQETKDVIKSDGFYIQPSWGMDFIIKGFPIIPFFEQGIIMQYYKYVDGQVMTMQYNNRIHDNEDYNFSYYMSIQGGVRF
jgi:hypothetical protein